MSVALTLHPFFSDQAVLPRDVAIPVHGRSVPGQTIKVTFAGQHVSARADAKGIWCATLKPIPAGGPHTLTVSMTSRQLIRRDIYTGDVWLVVGQSAMARTLGDLDSGEGRVLLASANVPRIRFYMVNPSATPKPETDGDGRWEKCSPEKAAPFSALGFHFARMLHEALECPVGIVQATVADSVGAAWLSPEAFRAHPDLAVRTGAATALRGTITSRSPGALFNGMLAPLTALPIRGVVAWQGESELGQAALHRAIATAQVEGWRKAWRRDDLPFLFVQLAASGEPRVVPADDPWAELREAQAMAARAPGAALTVAVDCGTHAAAQPRELRVVAERLILGALATAYHRTMPYSGPVFSAHTIRDGAVHLTFAHAESGLRARQPGPLLGFSVAGIDRVFRRADARIEDQTIVVSHPAIASPVAVRYAWESSPTLTVDNAAGLPTVPFRTDNWPNSAAGGRG